MKKIIFVCFVVFVGVNLSVEFKWYGKVYNKINI